MFNTLYKVPVPSSFSTSSSPNGSLGWAISKTDSFSPLVTVKWSLFPLRSSVASTPNNGLMTSGNLYSCERERGGDRKKEK